MSTFRYHPKIVERYPTVVGGIIFAHGLHNGPTPSALLAAYQAEQQEVRQRLEQTPLSQLPSLAAWRSAFRAFGAEPTQHRSAAEALLRRLTKKGDIPSINTLVDIGNLVSIRYALPVAIVDSRAIQGPLTVLFAEGNERFTNLGETEVVHPDPGEVIFSDESGLVFARRWCWRQSDESAARLDTTDVIITTEAHHAQGAEDVRAALHDLETLLHEYAGSNYSSGILDQHNLSVSDEA